jgi:hypothetical protein
MMHSDRFLQGDLRTLSETRVVGAEQYQVAEVGITAVPQQEVMPVIP